MNFLAKRSATFGAIELFVQLGEIAKLRNFYLVRIVVPIDVWDSRQQVDVLKLPTSNATPSGVSSMEFGAAWARSNASLLLEVPSVIIPEELNVLINPHHPDASLITSAIERQFQFDPRMEK